MSGIVGFSGAMACVRCVRNARNARKNQKSCQVIKGGIKGIIRVGERIIL